jgi:hypothetical protein
MPETKEQAVARAKRLGYPMSTVVQADNGDWFIAPLGVTTTAGKKAYANCRTKNADKGYCAAVAHKVDDAAKAKK